MSLSRSKISGLEAILSWAEDGECWAVRRLEAVMPVPNLTYGTFASVCGQLGGLRHDSEMQAMIGARRIGPMESDDGHGDEHDDGIDSHLEPSDLAA